MTPRPNQADARAIAQAVREAGAAVTLKTSEGEHGTVFVLGRDQGENATPSVVLAGEHYNMIARMLERGLPVKLRVNVQAHFVTDDPNSYNVIAEIPGTDPQLKSEVVLIGAHLDSWHTGTGASDNADGAAVVIEAMRILKTLGLQPKRTIRVALWGGEEEGLLGSKAYATQHLAGDANKDARDKMFVYLNMDPAAGPDLRLVHAGQRAGEGALRQVARAAARISASGATSSPASATPIISASAPPACPGSTRSRSTRTTTSACTTPTSTSTSACASRT